MESLGCSHGRDIRVDSLSDLVPPTVMTPRARGLLPRLTALPAGLFLLGAQNSDVPSPARRIPNVCQLFNEETLIIDVQ